MLRLRAVELVLFLVLLSTSVSAQSSGVFGTVRDETGGALPGVVVELRAKSGASQQATTDAQGAYRFDTVSAGRAQLSFGLVNFAGARRDVAVPPTGDVHVDVVMHLALSADVIVTGKSTFTNLADAEDPSQNLVGIAQSASQGAITARQLDTRPVMRTGEDPATGEPADPVTPLARAKGAEVGVRTVHVPHLQLSAALWSLNLDSELIFVGDAGTTEAGRPSHRYGLEIASYYTPRPWLIFDGDLSVSNARFTDNDPAGDFIPGAVATVISGGAAVDSVRNVFGSLRWRYFGPRALIEDDSVRSESTSLFNLEVGYEFTRTVRVALDVFNLFDARDSDIDYFYRSRLSGEPPGGVDDLHLHPALPRTARVSLILGF